MRKLLRLQLHPAVVNSGYVIAVHFSLLIACSVDGAPQAHHRYDVKKLRLYFVIAVMAKKLSMLSQYSFEFCPFCRTNRPKYMSAGGAISGTTPAAIRWSSEYVASRP